MFGSFTEEALLAYAEQIENRYREKAAAGGQGTEMHDNYGIGQNDKSFIEEDESQERDSYTGKVGKVKKALKQKGVINHSEAEGWYDFTACVRPDGSVYGTKGKCRLGKETSEDQAALLRASNRKRRRGTLGGSLKQRVARDEEANHLAGQLKDLAGERKKSQKRLSAAAANLEKNRTEEARQKYKSAQQQANDVFTRHEKVRTALNRRVRELTVEQKTQNAPARKKPTRDIAKWGDEGKQLG